MVSRLYRNILMEDVFLFVLRTERKRFYQVCADFEGTAARLGLVHLVSSTTAGNILVKLPKKPRKVAVNMFHDVLEQ
jgi:hypothetical protein